MRFFCQYIRVYIQGAYSDDIGSLTDTVGRVYGFKV